MEMRTACRVYSLEKEMVGPSRLPLQENKGIERKGCARDSISSKVKKKKKKKKEKKRKNLDSLFSIISSDKSIVNNQWQRIARCFND
ncbi:hypothetical protein NC651_038320 [Populus alba x Populus x berolinensis]|nr:hypothetical protein NC651_038320 [Populus alba x Populus x berolinensis]